MSGDVLGWPAVAKFFLPDGFGLAQPTAPRTSEMKFFSLRCFFCFAFFAALPFTAVTGLAAAPDSVEQWGAFEAVFKGPAEGNPFVDVEFSATFQQDDKAVSVLGFYDGDGVYRVRFMPETTGEWTYVTHSNRPELDGQTGTLTVTAPSAGNHGPVRVRDLYHFAYADGTPYWEIGTTCYAWIHQPEALQEETLKTLADAPFNKLRMCIFPKWMVYNRTEPELYPYVGTPPATWDFTRFNPKFFQHLEQRILDLQKLGIQADLILFHPYDEGHWGFDRMGAANDDRYLRYVLARLGAYRNVWWSLANEWDFVKTKTVSDWDRFGQIIQANDPYHHLCSIHNQKILFDHTQPWITHVSLQDDRAEDAVRYLNQYKKPVIFDECRYEGDISQEWGDITAERLTGMFWKTLISGAYCGHGETYVDPNDVLWWSKGGTLHGQSPARLAFFKKIIDAAPAAAAPLSQKNTWGVEGEYYLAYLWDRQHAYQGLTLPDNASFKAEIIDTWAMTVTPVPGVFAGHIEIPLPIKPYQAILLTRISGP
jgi:Domain of unknown function (DUF5060)/Protein of unknown function (DUF4038)/Domain of unknown function (DUF5605)